MNIGQDERPRTLWFGKKEPSNPITATPGLVHAPPGPLAGPTIQEKHLGPSQRNNHSHLSTIRQAVNQDPWTIYEARACVCYCRDVILARHRKHKLDIVHIQRLSMELSSTQALVKTIDQFPHQSFPRLLDFYHHAGDSFLVWEAVELSVNMILASRWRIEKVELAQIVWPVSHVPFHARNKMIWNWLVRTWHRYLKASNFFATAGERWPCWAQKRFCWPRLEK